MQTERAICTVREVVGIFKTAEDLESGIDELLSNGFDRSELGLLASETAVEKKLGHRYQRVSALADDPEVPRSAYVSTEAIGDAEGGLVGGLMFVGALSAAGAIVASGGTLATVIIATVLAGGTGTVIGAALAKWLGEHHAEYLQKQIDYGGLLLWVRTREAQDEKRAIEILEKHSGGHVHVHALPMHL